MPRANAASVAPLTFQATPTLLHVQRDIGGLSHQASQLWSIDREYFADQDERRHFRSLRGRQLRMPYRNVRTYSKRIGPAVQVIGAMHDDGIPIDILCCALPVQDKADAPCEIRANLSRDCANGMFLLLEREPVKAEFGNRHAAVQATNTCEHVCVTAQPQLKVHFSGIRQSCVRHELITRNRHLLAPGCGPAGDLRDQARGGVVESQALRIEILHDSLGICRDPP